MKKKIITITAAVLIFAFGVMAAPAIQTITAQLRPDLKVVIDGVEQEFYDAAGTQVYPVLYNGTTYLPLRAIGSSLGMSVDWNQDKFTATLTSENTASQSSYYGSLKTKFGEGEYLVGKDIAPGLYKLTSTDKDGDIYWIRWADASHEYTSVVASDWADFQCYVEVNNGEYFTLKYATAELQD